MTGAAHSPGPKNKFSSLVAGSSAGVLCAVVCSPLDVIRVRLQIQGTLKQQRYHGTIDAFKTILREEGVRGLYTGLYPAMMTIPVYWGVFFYAYDTIKNYTLEATDHQMHPIYSHISSAVSAGAISTIITNPFFVIRLRLQTLALHKQHRSLPADVSAMRMARIVYRKEGFGAFYKGLLASFLGLSQVAIQFPLYEKLKEIARNRRESGKEEIVDVIASSVTAKMIAELITYPADLVRNRLQDSSKDVGIRQLVRGIVRKDGPLGLYTGIRAYLPRVVPSTITTFVAYEYVYNMLNPDGQKR
jgi:solute carrier family 25 folate transporter 32